MKRDENIKIEDQSIRISLIASWNDFKNSILGSKEYYGLLGLVLAITGLFLNVPSTESSMLRIQAFLLATSIFSVVYVILVRPVLVYFPRKSGELYHAFTLIYIWLGGLLAYNLLFFLFNNYSEELFYFGRHLGVPIIAVFVNLLALYSFKFLRKRAIFQGDVLEWFFLVVLNVFLFNRYLLNGYEIIPTLQSFTEASYSNLNLIYVFLIYIYVEIYLWRYFIKLKIAEGWLIVWYIFITFVVLVPFILNYLINKIVV